MGLQHTGKLEASLLSPAVIPVKITSHATINDKEKAPTGTNGNLPYLSITTAFLIRFMGGEKTVKPSFPVCCDLEKNCAHTLALLLKTTVTTCLFANEAFIVIYSFALVLRALQECGAEPCRCSLSQGGQKASVELQMW